MQQYGRHAPTTVRFWRHVTFEPNSGCWLWVGGHNGLGYGRLWIGQGVVEYAHRFSYQLHCGDIASGLELDHLCHTPACVNPEHLEAVSHRLNIKRSALGDVRTNKAALAQARKTQCKHGRPLSGLNLYVYTSPRGKKTRGCKACRAARTLAAAETTKKRLAERKAKDPEFAARRRAYQTEWARKDRALKGGSNEQPV